MHTNLTFLIILVFSAPFLVGDAIQLVRWVKRRRREREMRSDLDFWLTRVSHQLTRMRQALGRAYAANANLTARLSDSDKDRRLRDEAGRSLSNAGRDLSQAGLRLSAASRATEAGPRDVSATSYEHCSERFSAALSKLSAAQGRLNGSQIREHDAWQESGKACMAAVHAAELASIECQALETAVACWREDVESGEYAALAKDWAHARTVVASARPQINHYLASAYQRHRARRTLAEESGRSGVISRVDSWCYKCEAMSSNVPDAEPDVCWNCGYSLLPQNDGSDRGKDVARE